MAILTRNKALVNGWILQSLRHRPLRLRYYSYSTTQHRELDPQHASLIAMSQRRSPPPCAAAPLSPSRGSSLPPNGVYPTLGWSLLVFFLLIGLGASVTDACGYCSDDSARDACAGSAFSCFASAVGFGPREDVSCHKADFGARTGCTSTEWRPGDVAVFKMVNGAVVSCSLLGSMDGLGSDGDNENMRTETLAPDVWMKISSLNEHAKDTDLCFLNVSSLRNVETSPFLDYEGLQSSTECDHSLADKKCFKLGGRKLSLQWLDVRSDEQSEMSAQKTWPILDMSSCKEGKDLGAVRLKMWRFKLDGIRKVAPMKVSKIKEKYTNIRTGPLQSITDITTRRRFSTFDSATNEAFVNPSEIVLLGPIVFYPSNRCVRRSSALIWHDLLGEEWLPILAFDSSKLSIVLEGSEPLEKLNFNSHLPISTSSVDLLSYMGNISSFCSHCMPKEIFAKHTGELPPEVKKVKALGADCSLDECMVHECNGLTLEPGESMRFLVSYEIDFPTAIVCRDFELALATGVFVSPIKASLAVYFLSVCGRAFYQELQWMVALFICTTVCMLMLLLICIIPNSFLLGSEEYYNEVDNTINDLNKVGKIHFHHHSGNFSRSSRGDENPQDGFANGYHICESAMLDQHKRTQLKKNFGHQRESAFTSPTLTVKPIKGVNKCSMLEEPESGNFSTRHVKEKRRRKRRPAITGLAAKLDASSSQSGNSTPSSPSSSNASIPKQTSPHSPESVDISADLSSEQKHQKSHDSEDTMKAKVLETEKNCMMARVMPNQVQLPNYPNLTGKSITILPLVKFPEYGSHESCVAARTVLPLRSPPVATSVRAPGPKRSKDKAIRTDEKNRITNEITYDIWGNYFSENFLCWKKDLATKMLDTVDGGSRSFFTRDPIPL